jgi:Mannose-6-phosphate isomerase
MTANLFAISNVTAMDDSREVFEEILTGGDGLGVERIVSNGQATPEGEWYDQDRDEWVVVLEGRARLAFDDGREIELGPGDHVFLPKRLKHRVTYTSRPCVWLAVFGNTLRRIYEKA